MKPLLWSPEIYGVRNPFQLWLTSVNKTTLLVRDVDFDRVADDAQARGNADLLGLPPGDIVIHHLVGTHVEESEDLHLASASPQTRNKKPLLINECAVKSPF